MNMENPSPAVNAEKQQDQEIIKKDFFSMDRSKLFKDQIIGSTPGISGEDLVSFCDYLNDIFNNINYEKPNEMVSDVLRIDFYVDWTRESLLCELEKEKKDQLKNSELKKQLSVFIQDIINSLCAILDTKKVGYLIELIIQKNIDILLAISYKSKIKISDSSIDRGPGGNLDGMSSLLGFIPNYREVSFTEVSFSDKNDHFKIKSGSVYRKEKDGKKTPIEEITEYTSINPELVKSKNIINLMAFDDFLYHNFNLPVRDISLKEKLYLYNFLLTNNLYQLHKFVATYKKQDKNINFFRTFLSIEQGGKEMGNKILTLGEKLPKEVAQEVFAKYGEIIDTADSIKDILEHILPDNATEIDQKKISEIKESLLIRAKNLLVNFHDKKEANSEELLKDLKRYQSVVLLYADTYKKLKESGREVKLEEIKNTEISILSQEDKEKNSNELWDITIANRPFIKDAEDIKKRKAEFFSTIENKDSDFYILKHRDKVLAFCSFTQDENGDMYAESLNVESEIRGAQIGGEFFPTVLEKIKNSGKDIYGHVHPLNSKILPYYERLGFKIKEIKEGEKLKYYEIRIPAEKILKEAA